MTNEQFFALELPKWSCILVTGKKVTLEQAMEILIRTDSFYFSTNDLSFKKRLKAAVGFTEQGEDEDWREHYAKQAAIKESLGILPLGDIHNSRIVSCWIGGPHGWCDWNGNIFTNNYNIGKYPSVQGVYEDWCKIAEAFPYLDLRCQLLSGESCEEDAKPVVEFVVKEGTVTMVIPESQLLPTVEPDFTSLFIGGNTRERGCNIETFKRALELCRSKVSV